MFLQANTIKRNKTYNIYTFNSCIQKPYRYFSFNLFEIFFRCIINTIKFDPLKRAIIYF